MPISFTNMAFRHTTSVYRWTFSWAFLWHVFKFICKFCIDNFLVCKIYWIMRFWSIHKECGFRTHKHADFMFWNFISKLSIDNNIFIVLHLKSHLANNEASKCRTCTCYNWKSFTSQKILQTPTITPKMCILLFKRDIY